MINEFTKEELILIAESIPYLLHLEPEKRTYLLYKIDKMIKDFCDHNSLRQKGDDEYVALCRDCGKLFQ